ncbi:hypothetical protein BGZ76_005668, partial [Entomortierella beljakovae]
METYIRPRGIDFDDTPSVIFCEIDAPPSFIDLVQKASDNAGLLYVLIRKNASAEQYKQYIFETYPPFSAFLVYDGSDNMLCYGIEEGEMEGVKMTLRCLGTYSIDMANGYDTYADY